jgi:phosphoserine phosphatase
LLLDAVDIPVCVHPDRWLRAHALAKKWEILEEQS